MISSSQGRPMQPWNYPCSRGGFCEWVHPFNTQALESRVSGNESGLNRVPTPSLPVPAAQVAKHTFVLFYLIQRGKNSVCNVGYLPNLFPLLAADQ